MSEALLVVTGSRAWPRFQSQVVDNTLWDAYCGLVVSGPFTMLRVAHGYCRKGVDELADEWALARYDQGVRVKRIRADWEAPCRDACAPGHRRHAGYHDYCPAAGNYRNQELIDLHPHATVGLVWSENSKGTWDCIRRSVAANVPTLIVRRGRQPEWANPERTAWTV